METYLGKCLLQMSGFYITSFDETKPFVFSSSLLSCDLLHFVYSGLLLVTIMARVSWLLQFLYCGTTAKSLALNIASYGIHDNLGLNILLSS